MTRKRIAVVVRRLQLVKLALKNQQSMSQLCRRFGMSRKSGYKWLARFEREGLLGLQDRGCRPHRSPRQISLQWIIRIRRLRRRHPTWGSRKLAARLRREYPRHDVPCVRTIGNWLKRLKLIRRQKRKRRSGPGPRMNSGALTVATRSNHVWTVDFKGWFRTADGRRVEPLTVRDAFSCYVLTVHLLGDQSWRAVRKVFLRLFSNNGYPTVMRMDNGTPFGSKGPAGLTRLSAWWTALGIRVEFITPGHPQENGAHEQMHGVLKKEATRPASRHLRAQQRRLRRWMRVYNQIRPHEGLDDRTPMQAYRPKPASIRLPEVKYPRRLAVRRVRTNGEIRWKGRKRFIGEAFVGYPVGIQAKGSTAAKVYFGRIFLGELWDSDAGAIRAARYIRAG
jgi:putative transposase